jgi:6-pyruvoyltetrahydropterin/6-carboxytetrahydropterin synthase
LFVLIDRFIQLNQMVNGEREVKLESVIIHETDTGYAQCFREDAYSDTMGEISLEKIIFSDEIRSDWRDGHLHKKLVNGIPFLNPSNV